MLMGRLVYEGFPEQERIYWKRSGDQSRSRE